MISFEISLLRSETFRVVKNGFKEKRTQLGGEEEKDDGDIF
jgi:hypothetical protein